MTLYLNPKNSSKSQCLWVWWHHQGSIKPTTHNMTYNTLINWYQKTIIHYFLEDVKQTCFPSTWVQLLKKSSLSSSFVLKIKNLWNLSNSSLSCSLLITDFLTLSNSHTTAMRCDFSKLYSFLTTPFVSASRWGYNCLNSLLLSFPLCCSNRKR